ncbi:MAG: hypothetical protein KUG52_06935 [Immundisolibacteraceae bacterium]|nr:hypothetical protein [Immundisolibacteraceae bacterium]
MFQELVTSFRQSRFARHLPSLLGLSLLPLHISGFGWNSATEILLLSNHAILAGIWYLSAASDRLASTRLIMMLLLTAVIGFFWSLPLATIIWLGLLSASIIGRSLCSPRELLNYSPAATYLLIVGIDRLSTTGWFPVSLPGLVGHIALLVAVSAALRPLSGQQNDKHASDTEQLYTALALTSIIASTSLFILLYTPNKNNLPTILLSFALLFCYQLVLLMSARRYSSSLVRNSIAFQLWFSETLEAVGLPDNDQTFLQGSLTRYSELMHLPHCQWQVGGLSGQLGQPGDQRYQVVDDQEWLTISADSPISSQEQQQASNCLNLLKSLIQSKQQAQQIKAQRHMESIYETGARITHDVKNLLQSLNTLTSAVDHSKPEQAPAIQNLIKKQLPLIRQKLQSTLEKLAAPEDVSSTFQVARIWWEKIQLRYAERNIEFRQELTLDHLVPRDLFERVAENLLENAYRKRQAEPDIRILVDFEATEQRVALRVTDNGSPAPDEIASLLFKGPIDSTSGYGIALYQCATQAVQQGFQLTMTHNEPGNVSFYLVGDLQ